MRVKGAIGTHTLSILIDSGSSHNFLDEKVASKLGCVRELMERLKVAAANGHEMDCLENCKRFTWRMQGQEFKTNILILRMDSYDLILVVQWLSKLGTIS